MYTIYGNIKLLIEYTLTLFPYSIDISDCELRNDDGSFIKNLSDAWHEVEDRNAVIGNVVDFMIWAIYGLLHRKSSENYSKGISPVTLNELSVNNTVPFYVKLCMKKADDIMQYNHIEWTKFTIQ